MEVQTTASDHSNAVKHPGDTYTDKYENTSNRLCSKGNVFPYSLPSVGPELIPVYRQSARRWREVNHAIDPAVGCRYFLPGLR